MVIHNEAVCQRDSPVDDKVNHGTLVAGVIWRYAGQIIDGFKGEKSVVKLINIKIDSKLTPLGQGFMKALQAIDKWEQKNNKKVDMITTSMGLVKENQKGQRKEMTNLNGTFTSLSGEKVIIAAASNDGKTNHQTVAWPATNGYVLGINAINDMGNATDFAPQGDGIDFAFPGFQIASTSRPPSQEELNSGMIVLRRGTSNEWWAMNRDGTSFAAPHCAASVAIVLAYVHIGLGKEARKAITNTEFMKELLLKISETQRDHRMGYGFPKFDQLTLEGIKDYLIANELLDSKDLNSGNINE